LPAQAKLEAVKGLVEKLKEAKAVVFVDYKGISVNEDTELRKTARESGVEYLLIIKGSALMKILNFVKRLENLE